MQTYRPSNGTEGDIFYAQWCALCLHDIDHECDILARAICYGIDCEHYPSEWISDENGPECTGFQSINDSGGMAEHIHKYGRPNKKQKEIFS